MTSSHGGIIFGNRSELRIDGFVSSACMTLLRHLDRKDSKQVRDGDYGNGTVGNWAGTKPPGPYITQSIRRGMVWVLLSVCILSITCILRLYVVAASLRE